MGKTLRIRILIIALIFFAITVGAVIGIIFSRDALTMSAFMYGSGTESDPYRIYNSTQMLNLQEVTDSRRASELTKGKHFLLCADIETTRIPRDYGRGFYGSFDGGGYTITTRRYGLFYDLRDGATVKNLNFKFDLCDYYNAYVLCYNVREGAVIQNCNAYGNIDIKIYKSSGNTTCGMSVFSRNNYGTIRDCTYTGRITKSGELYCGQFDLGIVSAFDYKETSVVENCTVNCDIDVVTPAYGQFNLFGISQRAKNCTYNGNIDVRDNKKTYRVAKVNIYGLGDYAADCTFNGDITVHDMSRLQRLVVALTSAGNGDNTFNGKIIGK